MFTPRSIGYAVFSAVLVGFIASVSLEFSVTAANFWWGVFNGGVFLAVFALYFRHVRAVRAEKGKTYMSVGFIVQWTLAIIGLGLVQMVIGRFLGLDTHGLVYEQGFWSFFGATVLWLSQLKSFALTEMEKQKVLTGNLSDLPVSFPPPDLMKQRIDALAQAVNTGSENKFAQVEAKFKEAMLDHVYPTFVSSSANRALESLSSAYRLKLDDETPPVAPNKSKIVTVSVVGGDSTDALCSFEVYWNVF